jgi:hypothetical protein
LSSSRAFSGGGFFGKTAYTPATVTKENKPNSSIDPVHASAYRRDIHPPDRLSGKASLNGDDKNIYHPVSCLVACFLLISFSMLTGWKN